MSRVRIPYGTPYYAEVAELAYAVDLKSTAERIEGSNPFFRTIFDLNKVISDLNIGRDNVENITIYECKDGRARVYLKDEKKVISYPRYLLGKILGRELHWNEQVHHKDENPLNNNLDNLEIKLLGEHQRDHNPVKYQDELVVCAWCNKPFLWTAKQQIQFYANRKRKDRIGRQTSDPFCSKKCAGKYGKYIQTCS